MPSKLAALPKVTDYKANEVDQNAQALADLTAEQEALIQFPSFTPEDAWTIGSTIRETFLESYSGNGTLGVVIHIETFTGHRLFSNAVGNPATVGPENWLWVQAKTNVVKRFGVSSLRKGRQLAVKGQTAEGNGLHFPEYACHGGAIPIYIKNTTACPIGVIVVSGLPQLHDHQLIIDSLAKLDKLFA